MTTAAEILRRPYSRVIIPEDDGTYFAQIREFPGCIASADTSAEALVQIEEVAQSWIEAALARRQKIPEPAVESEYSGKLVVRLPKSLHEKAALAAERDGASLNSLINTAIAFYVGGAEQKAAFTSGQFQSVNLVFGEANFNQITGFNVSAAMPPAGNLLSGSISHGTWKRP